jgi:hypothetical protein
MDLQFLIPSKMRRLVLEYFVTQPDVTIHVSELARELKSAPQLVYRELINMENWGLLLSSKRGNQRVYRVNQRFVFLAALVELYHVRQTLTAKPPRISKVYDWDKLSTQYSRIAIPDDLDQGLRLKRTKLRSYDEEVSLKKKHLL